MASIFHSMYFQEDSNEELWKNSELSGSSFSTLLENLRAKLQQRDGDVTNLRVRLVPVYFGPDMELQFNYFGLVGN